MFELIQYAVAILLGASAVNARPAISLAPRQTSNSSLVAITGATQGNVQPRLEIHTLMQNADQWNIYLLALQAFQAMDTSDPQSWYQIAGIHGVPYVPYNGVDACTGCNLNTGYCTHSSTLFPTWHRAYMALFEQSLQANAIAVANQFTGDDKTRYLQAATDLRMPYWDWALPIPEGEDPFPQFLTQTTVTVNSPIGQGSIANPLLQYSFGSADHSFMATSYTPDSDVTVRSPSFTAQSRESLRQDLYTTLTSSQGYASFATESLYQYRDNWNPFSIEMLHDRVHAQVGGDMGFIPTAAFDPVFFLHHGAVDHAFALWQAAYPDEWLQPWSEVGSTYTYTKGTVEDSSSPLTPYRSDTSGSFWTSDALRDTTALNYNYADLATGASAASIINSLYGSSSTVSTRDLHEDGKRYHHEYIADITADSMGTNGTFVVFFFDGPVNEKDASDWRDSTNLMTTHAFFTGPEKKGDGTALSNGGVSLNPALRKAVKAGDLEDMELENVQAYLKKNLSWRVKMLGGHAVPASSIPGFDVTILSSDVQQPESNDELPKWSTFKVLRI